MNTQMHEYSRPDKPRPRAVPVIHDFRFPTIAPMVSSVFGQDNRFWQHWSTFGNVGQPAGETLVVVQDTKPPAVTPAVPLSLCLLALHNPHNVRFRRCRSGGKGDVGGQAKRGPGSEGRTGHYHRGDPVCSTGDVQICEAHPRDDYWAQGLS